MKEIDLKSKPKLIMILGIVGIMLIGLSSFVSDDKSQAETNDYSAKTQGYIKDTEQRMTDILKQTNGVGRVAVMLTLESGTEYIYAKDEKQIGGEGTTESKYILIDNSTGRRQALVVTELQPKIKGVVVVCDGSKDPVVRQRVTDVVTTALGVNSLQVCILEFA